MFLDFHLYVVADLCIKLSLQPLEKVALCCGNVLVSLTVYKHFYFYFVTHNLSKIILFCETNITQNMNFRFAQCTMSSRKYDVVNIVF